MHIFANRNSLHCFDIFERSLFFGHSNKMFQASLTAFPVPRLESTIFQEILSGTSALGLRSCQQALTQDEIWLWTLSILHSSACLLEATFFLSPNTLPPLTKHPPFSDLCIFMGPLGFHEITVSHFNTRLTFHFGSSRLGNPGNKMFTYCQTESVH